MKRIRKLTTAFLVIALLVTSLVSVPALAEDDDYDKVIRLAGASRYLTAVEVSKEAYEEGADTVIIAAGENFPDALAASALAGKLDAPILLAEQDGFRAGTLEEIERLGATKAIVLGGEKALGEEVVDALEDAGLKVTRIAGENRYETAALIAKEVLKLNPGKEVFLVNGDEPWDALAIGPVAAAEGIPVLLTKAGALRAETKAFLVDNGVKTVTILGGEKAISAAVRDEIYGMGIAVKRFGGANREETAIKIAEEYFPNAQTVVVASREKFADALVGGYFGGLQEAPIMLVYEKSIRENVDEYILGMGVDLIYILGGEAVVSKAVADELDGYGVVKSVAAIAGQKLEEEEDYLLFKVNGKWEVDAEDFRDMFSDYTLEFLYDSAGLSIKSDDYVATDGGPFKQGKGKYAVKVAENAPGGAVFTSSFVAFAVLAEDDIAEVLEHKLVRVDGEGLDIEVGATVTPDDDALIGTYQMRAVKAVTVGGEIITPLHPKASLLPTFEGWVKSKNANIISIDDETKVPVIEGLGKATLIFTYAGLDTEYGVNILVQEGPRVPTSIGTKDQKAFTYPTKTFNLSEIIVLDQFKEELDFNPYLVITAKGLSANYVGLATSATGVTGMGTAGTYTITAYNTSAAATDDDHKALAVAKNKIGSYTITTVVKGDKDVPSFKLAYVNSEGKVIPPPVTELDLNQLDPVESLWVSVTAFIKNVPLTATDLAQVFDSADTFVLKTAKVKVAGPMDDDTVVEKLEIDLADLYDPIQIALGAKPEKGTVALSFHTVDGDDAPKQDTLSVPVVDTTPQIKDLKLKGKKLEVKKVGTGWELAQITEIDSGDYATQLTSADLAKYTNGKVHVANMIASVTFYGGDFPYAIVKIKPVYGGESFRFDAKLVD